MLSYEVKKHINMKFSSAMCISAVKNMLKDKRCAYLSKVFVDIKTINTMTVRAVNADTVFNGRK